MPAMRSVAPCVCNVLASRLVSANTAAMVGVGALIIDAGRILLVRRAAAPLKGKWSIPGGVLEVGETLIAAVKREALEETGLVVEVLELAGVVDRIIPDSDGRTLYHYVLADYVCKLASQKSELHAGTDVDDARWAAKSEVGLIHCWSRFDRIFHPRDSNWSRKPRRHWL